MNWLLLEDILCSAPTACSAFGLVSLRLSLFGDGVLLPFNVYRASFGRADRKELDPAGPEDVTGTDMMRAQVRNIIDAELAKGIELSRIVVGGFSMGAAQSLHMLSDPELCAKLAGVFAMSTFLPDDSVLPDRVARHTSAGGRVPPVLWFHGTADPMIRLRSHPPTIEPVCRDITEIDVRAYVSCDQVRCCADSSDGGLFADGPKRATLGC